MNQNVTATLNLIDELVGELIEPTAQTPDAEGWSETCETRTTTYAEPAGEPVLV